VEQPAWGQPAPRWPLLLGAAASLPAQRIPACPFIQRFVAWLAGAMSAGHGRGHACRRREVTDAGPRVPRRGRGRRRRRDLCLAD